MAKLGRNMLWFLKFKVIKSDKSVENTESVLKTSISRTKDGKKSESEILAGLTATQLSFDEGQAAT
jgi:hypothetical protein